MRGAIVALLLAAALPAAAEERRTEIDVASAKREAIPVFNMEDDGSVTLDVIAFPVLPKPMIPYMCIREFGAAQIRCYIINSETRAVITTDVTPTKP